MHDAVFRLVYVLRFLAFMAIVYLALHVMVARFVTRSDSKILAFFSILTHPLTKPVRSLLERGAPETRVRYVTLAALFLLWLILAGVMSILGAGAA